MKFYFRLAALLGAVNAVTVPAVSAEIELNKSSKKTSVLMDLKLSKRQKSRFREFKTKEYFAAFVVSGQNSSGWVANRHSLAVAKEQSLRDCRLLSEYPDTCAVYAVTVPKDYDPNFGGTTLSQYGNSSFREYQKKNSASSSGAFVIAENGSVGYSWGFPDPIEAQENAILACESDVAKWLVSIKKQVRDKTPKSQTTCRVIHEARP
ncbi:hypothetical protein [Ruegeria arenilitoris]|uniref:hypothetical protein n=1 Tax=Ruegeria arenilitoris TaxID=1173585 RepID=UPI001480E059|nr:hypothetical protein [Ruegeria arenilitoris]